jgi:hypothetical protein
MSELFSLKTIKIFSNDIYVEQDVRDKLWQACVFEKETFDEYCAKKDYNWEVIKLDTRLNPNFFTRDRWFDLDVIVDKLGISLGTFVKEMKIPEQLILDWKLTRKQRKELSSPCPTTRPSTLPTTTTRPRLRYN